MALEFWEDAPSRPDVGKRISRSSAGAERPGLAGQSCRWGSER
uniref:Uncharacterized protein n=1 Tax=Setaria italica TaxID=4555 RepID=K3ZP82_SETIT